MSKYTKSFSMKNSSKVSDGYANFVTRVGFTPGYNNNVLSDSTYVPTLLTWQRVKLETMYRSSWIVGIVVDSIAEDMTRSGITITGSIEPSRISYMQKMMTRLGIWGALLENIKWGRLYGGSIAVIDIEGQDISTPLDINTISKGQFKGLKIYDRWQIQPSVTQLVESGKEAGNPEYYTILSNVATGEPVNAVIHYTRVIRHIGIQLPNWQAVQEQFWGESVIERLQDRLIAFDEATMSAANLVKRANIRTIKVENLRDVLAAGGKIEENLLKQFKYMSYLQNNEALSLLDSRDSLQIDSYSFGGLSDIMLQMGQQVSGSAGIPLVRLFGQSPAGLNSTGESDFRMYYDRVYAEQESNLREGLTIVLTVLYMSLFGENPPDDFDFDFVPLWQTTHKEKTEIASMTSTLISLAYEKGIIDQETALKELKQSGDNTGIFTNISDEQIELSKLSNAPEPVITEEVEEIGKKSTFDKIKSWLTRE